MFTPTYILHVAEPVDRRDFSPDVIVVKFESDEFGIQVSERSVPVEIFDDEIDEAHTEVFIISIFLNESMDSRSGISISRASSLCLIADDDGNDCNRQLESIQHKYSFLRHTDWVSECQLHIY